MALAVDTSTGVKMARWFSSGVLNERPLSVLSMEKMRTLNLTYLFVYQVDNSGETMNPPQHSRKHAKYPTATFCATSTAAKMMKPTQVIMRQVARCKHLSPK